MSDCVAVRLEGPCSVCALSPSCHGERGCGCACAEYKPAVCGIELIENPDGSCAEREGDYPCGGSAAHHCAAADPYTLHLCHSDMSHHPFVAPFTHAAEPEWAHRIQFPRPTPTKPPVVIKPIFKPAASRPGGMPAPRR